MDRDILFTLLILVLLYIPLFYWCFWSVPGYFFKFSFRLFSLVMVSLFRYIYWEEMFYPWVKVSVPVPFVLLFLAVLFMVILFLPQCLMFLYML